jgi:hypothetical protein
MVLSREALGRRCLNVLSVMTISSGRRLELRCLLMAGFKRFAVIAIGRLIRRPTCLGFGRAGLGVGLFIDVPRTLDLWRVALWERLIHA